MSVNVIFLKRIGFLFVHDLVFPDRQTHCTYYNRIFKIIINENFKSIVHSYLYNIYANIYIIRIFLERTISTTISYRTLYRGGGCIWGGLRPWHKILSGDFGKSWWLFLHIFLKPREKYFQKLMSKENKRVINISRCQIYFSKSNSEYYCEFSR